MAQNGTLSPAQVRAVAAIMVTHTTTAAAEKAEVSLRTLQRWLTDPAFQAALAQAEADLLAGTTRMLLTASGQAVVAMATIMTGKDTPATSRLRAADLLLVHGVRWYELRTLEARLAALEEEVLTHDSKR